MPLRCREKTRGREVACFGEGVKPPASPRCEAAYFKAWP
jgi:hypothetical protein